MVVRRLCMQLYSEWVTDGVCLITRLAGGLAGMANDEYVPPPWLPGTSASMALRRRILPLPDVELHRLAWSPNGGLLAGTADRGVFIYDLLQGEGVPRLVHARRQSWGDVAWSPD